MSSTGTTNSSSVSITHERAACVGAVLEILGSLVNDPLLQREGRRLSEGASVAALVDAAMQSRTRRTMDEVVGVEG